MVDPVEVEKVVERYGVASYRLACVQNPATHAKCEKLRDDAKAELLKLITEQARQLAEMGDAGLSLAADFNQEAADRLIEQNRAIAAEAERDAAMEDLGRVIMACPMRPDMRTSPAHHGVRKLREAFIAAEVDRDRLASENETLRAVNAELAKHEWTPDDKAALESENVALRETAEIYRQASLEAENLLGSIILRVAASSEGPIKVTAAQDILRNARHRIIWAEHDQLAALRSRSGAKDNG